MINCTFAGPDIMPGATFDQKFLIPLPATTIVYGTIIYQQLGDTKLQLEIGTDATVEPLDAEASVIVVPFTQGRSLVFDQPYPAECQINILTDSGERAVTEIMTLSVGTNMDMEVMTV